MGSDELFKKRRAALKERKKEIKEPIPNSFLIVSEGAKTEPLYFDGLANYIKEKFGGAPTVKTPVIDTYGEGKCTCSLVQETLRIVKKAHIMYEQVWVVFDKDDFEDFDKAIKLADALGFKTAWSNQSFEFWIYLHFNFCDSDLHRAQWVEKLDQIFKQLDIGKSGYEKNDEEIFKIATTFGSLKLAVNSAKRIKNSYKNTDVPSQCAPCTTVYGLIEELKPFLEELLE